LARALRRTSLSLALPALVGASTLFHWLEGRRFDGLWIMPDEAIYADRALALWHHGNIPVFRGQGAGYGLLYPALAGIPLAFGDLATGYTSLKLLQALVISLVAVPIFFYGRRLMRPAYALLAAALAVASPLCLYSGLVMTEVLIYPLGACALLAMARAVETASTRDQLVALVFVALAILTRVQAVVLLPVFLAAVLLGRRSAWRSFWPLWGTGAAAVVVGLAAPSVLGAYSATLHRHYALRSAARLTYEHFAYLTLSTGVVTIPALAILLVARRDVADRAERAVVVVTACAIVFVVAQVGGFASEYAPHLLGRDLALLPPTMFVVFALWLDRGAPRPRAVAGYAALLVFAALVLAPWQDLVNINALPDTFGISPLFDLGAHHAGFAVAAVAAVALAAFLLVPRRLAVTLAALVFAGLTATTVVAGDDVARRVQFDQRNLVGVPPTWVDDAAGGPVTLLYDGEFYWNGVWQLRFWNRDIDDVVSLEPSRVPGPMAQRAIAVSPTGRLPVHTRYVVASDPHELVGEPVAHLAQAELDVGGETLWRLEGPPRLSMVRRGIQANGDMDEPATLRVYNCQGGRLELTLLPKSTNVVTLRLDGRIVQNARIGGLDYWNGSIDVPPSPQPRVCHFEIDPETLLGSTRIAFVRP
jgi:hypothetical protein